MFGAAIAVARAKNIGKGILSMSSRYILPSIAAFGALFATVSLMDSNKAIAQTVPAAQGDAATGAKLFVQCRACHTVNVGGRDGVGPNLAGVMGKNAAARTTYTYSAALRNSKIRWTKDSMDNFLKRPSAAVPGNKMGFGGMANPKARADMIAYLETLRAR
jgi:cytochrome c